MMLFFVVNTLFGTGPMWLLPVKNKILRRHVVLYFGISAHDTPLCFL